MQQVIQRVSAALFALVPVLHVGHSAALDVLDDLGNRLHLAAPPARIVSLAPGATEMLFAAGAGERIVGTSEYSDEPAAARRIPRIGDSNAVDLERLLLLHPDVVVVWPGGNSAALIEKVRRLGLPMYFQRADRLGDLAPSLLRLGQLAGTQAVAEATATALESRIAGLRRDYGARAPVRVMMEVWNNPLYTIGGPQLMTDALQACGALNVFGDLPELGPVVQLESVIARDPDVIVALASDQAQEWLAVWRAFPMLKAVKRGNLVAFGNKALSRLGPSAVQATADLCGVIEGARRRLHP